MAVSDADLRHVAALARLGLDEARIPVLLRELNGILGHMEALRRVSTRDAVPVSGIGAGGMPLRADEGPQYPLHHAHDAFAPSVREGFFLVPRLGTHGGDGAEGAPDPGVVDDALEAELEEGT